MRVLLIGAGGFIGSAIAARLRRDGHEVVSVVRPASVTAAGDGRRIGLDLTAATTPGVWLPHLTGVDAVVNAAGVLQDGPGASTAAVHRDAAAALFAACEQAGVRRVIHFSAIGVDRETPSDFSRTKQQGEAALMARDLDWVILRPSVVVGRAAYGGSALVRGLAALQLQPEMPGGGPIQVVQLDDVVETVAFFLRPGAPARVALDLAGPDRLSFDDVVRTYRRWLRFPPARRWRLPTWLSNLAYRFGDFVGWLGWRTPMRSIARLEMPRGAVGDPGPWTAMTGIQPRSLADALAAEPASVQERWFARLYVLKPLAFGVFALFWIGTGLISLGPGWKIGVDYMLEGGAGALAGPSVIAGALADIVIGVAIAFRRTAKWGLYGALAISLFYAAAGTIILPRLWIDPLGPMLKIWPIIVLNLMLLAIVEDR